MVPDAKKSTPPVADKVLQASRDVLLEAGFAGLSTRKVADRAGVPLSQIHYHFGSKAELILALLRWQNDPLVERQTAMFGLDVSLSQRWDRACDYLDDDLDSGYVRVLQEMTAAGWSSLEVRSAVQDVFSGWTSAHVAIVEEAQAAGVDFGPFSVDEVVALIQAVFLGAESMLLLGRECDTMPIRQALRRIGEAIARHEQRVER